MVDHLLGKTKEPSQFEVGLSTFGVGRELSPGGWRDLIDQLLFEGLLGEDPNDGRPLVGLGDADGGARRSIAASGGSRCAARPRASTARPALDGRASARATALEAVAEADAPLFEALRAWRSETAAEQGVPPYVIFHDRTLPRSPAAAQRRPPTWPASAASARASSTATARRC